MTRQLSTTIPHYSINFSGETATFIWSPNAQETLKSSVDLKIKTRINELKWLCENFGCILRDGKSIIPNLDVYNRLLIYACVRPLMRTPEKVRELATLVSELNSWDSLYWASRFRETWWEKRGLKSIRRIAKAFKLFFNL